MTGGRLPLPRLRRRRETRADNSCQDCARLRRRGAARNVNPMGKTLFMRRLGFRPAQGDVRCIKFGRRRPLGCYEMRPMQVGNAVSPPFLDGADADAAFAGDGANAAR